MNRKQRRIQQSQDKPKAAIHFRGRAYTIEEAGALAIQEQNLRNLQAAVDIYNLILAQVPDYGEVYNNCGVALQEMKRYDKALASYDKALSLNPDNVEACNNRGVTLQEMKRYDEALASYDKAVMLNPDNGEVYNNRGVTLQALKRYDEALASYDKAITLKPGYGEAHNNRGVTLQEMKRYDEALASYDKAVALKPDYAEAHNNRGATLQKMQRNDEALASCDKAISLKPDYAEAHNNRGNALLNLKRYDDALASYDKAIELKPDYGEAYSNRGVTLKEMRRYDEALASCDKALSLNPDYANAHNSRGSILQKMKRYDDALVSCDTAIALEPDYAGAYQNRGLILVNKGDMPGAERMFLKAFALKPDFPDPLSNLANIRKYRDADNADVRNIQDVLDKPGTSADDREYLYFSLGKIYDDCGLWDEAFECYRQANQIRGSAVSYNADEVTAMTSSIMEVFSKDFLAQKFAFSSDSRAPVFIVGMPRSGTTLMASILSNHPRVATAGELETIMKFASSLPEWIEKPVPYPQAVKHITPAIAARLTETYLKRLRRDADEGIPHVIDKHPLNFWHLGFIAMLFPQARIIHCTRHPLDTGLSNYFQRFALYYDYAFDLRNIGHFYGEYARLMEHWRGVLPLTMIEVSYEDMVMNTEQVARRTLDFLGLEWDVRCLAPHTNPNPVETASQWQVRQPIYNQSVERWRHYEKHLAPLKEMLQLAGQIPV